MSRERWLLLGTVVFLLIGGLLVGRYLVEPPQTVLMTLDSAENASAFRTWLWAHRGLDLGVQAALIFVGALGIAAVLPNNKEGPDTCT